MPGVRWAASGVRCPNCKVVYGPGFMSVEGRCPICLLPLAKRRVRSSGGQGPRQVRALLRRDGDACWLCSEPLGDDVTRDHVVPVSKGGSDKLTNLRLAHKLCNQRRGNADAPETVSSCAPRS